MYQPTSHSKYHYTTTLYEEEDTETILSNLCYPISDKRKRRLKKKQRRLNRRMKNTYFKRSVEEKWYENPHYQSDTDYVMIDLGYY